MMKKLLAILAVIAAMVVVMPYIIALADEEWELFEGDRGEGSAYYDEQDIDIDDETWDDLDQIQAYEEAEEEPEYAPFSAGAMSPAETRDYKDNHLPGQNAEAQRKQNKRSGYQQDNRPDSDYEEAQTGIEEQEYEEGQEDDEADETYQHDDEYDASEENEEELGDYQDEYDDGYDDEEYDEEYDEQFDDSLYYQ